MSVEGILIVNEGICILIWNPEDILFAVAWNDLVAILRIQVLELIQRRSSKFAYLLEMQHLVYPESVDRSRKLYGYRLDAMFFVEFHGI